MAGPSGIGEAIALARRGLLPEARGAAEAALANAPDDGPLLALLGALCSQTADNPAAATYLQRALERHPGDITIRANLLTALVALGRLEEAEILCPPDRAAADPSLRLWRLRAYILQQRDRAALAADAYAHVVERAPGDFEAWNNLGNARLATGDGEGAITALQRASSLRTDIASIQINLAGALAQARGIQASLEVLRRCVASFSSDPAPRIELGLALSGLDRNEEAIEAFREAARLAPNDPEIEIKRGLVHALLLDFEEAMAAFRGAIAIRQDHGDAHLQLAIVLEQNSRLAELATLIAEAEMRNVDADAVRLMRALLLRRERRYIEALAAASETSPDQEPVRRQQLIGDMRDRTGDAAGAFEAFSAMNAAAAADPSAPRTRAAGYRGEVRAQAAMLTAAWIARWRQVELVPHRPAPVFLIGFPRSGTTLLDTFLLGHPTVQVVEERPTLRGVDSQLGSYTRLPDLAAAEIGRLRERYFRDLAAFASPRPGGTVIDKFPLYMNRVPLIHRLFPDARVILALRHPLDVVLSCYITNFKLNHAMSNFLDLGDAAALYDLSFTYLEKCRELLPLQIHVVRYEELIADQESVLRPLLDYLGLPWHGPALDHVPAAAGRGHIPTASYAQVTEGIYDRARGRWTRYRDQLAPVIPIIEPWIEKLGYSL